MRLSPDATRYGYVAGKGETPARPRVTVVDADGTSVELEAGHDPRWEFGEQLVFRPQEDGVVRFAGAPRWSIGVVDLPAGNEITAAAGRVAVSRTDPPRILCSWRPPILGATHPVLSDDGDWLVYRRADYRAPNTSTLILERADGSIAARDLWTGEPTAVRAGGRTFMWQIGGGRIAGIADVGNPNLEAAAFDVPGWRLYEPVPVWHTRRGELGSLFLADDGRNGHIHYATWGSLQQGKPIGRYLGASTGSGYEHDARPLGLDVRAAWLSGSGLPVDRMVDLDAPRAELKPPVPVVTPTPIPVPVPPDIAWTPDARRTVDMLDFVTAAAAARRDRGDGTGELWMHKSQERPNWGENWDFDRDYIGFVEDRSTGTRMVSMTRPKTHSHTNTRRNRLAPETILELNAEGANLGDPATLPLAGYTWRGNRVWLIRHVTGRATRSFHTDYVWWDLPEFGGVWEVWAGLALTIEIETGYGRFNGHEVFARSRYGKPQGNEWNYWGPHGWVAFRAYDEHGLEEPGSARTAPPEQRASLLAAPFVQARFTPTYPIYDAARERPTPTPEPQPPQKGPDVSLGVFLRAIPRDQVFRGIQELDTALRARPELDLATGLFAAGDGTGGLELDRGVAYGLTAWVSHLYDACGGQLPGADAGAYDRLRADATARTVRQIERERGIVVGGGVALPPLAGVVRVMGVRFALE